MQFKDIVCNMMLTRAFFFASTKPVAYQDGTSWKQLPSLYGLVWDHILGFCPLRS